MKMLSEKVDEEIEFEYEINNNIIANVSPGGV